MSAPERPLSGPPHPAVPESPEPGPKLSLGWVTLLSIGEDERGCPRYIIETPEGVALHLAPLSTRQVVITAERRR